MLKLALVFTLVSFGLPAQQAFASEESAVMAPLRQFIDGFNKGDLKAAAAACTADASVIDDFPPHGWHGNGCQKWADGYAAVASKEGITAAKITAGEPRHVDINGDYAYVVLPVSLVVDRGEKQKTLPSIFTAALQLESGGWRMTAWAWADL